MVASGPGSRALRAARLREVLPIREVLKVLGRRVGDGTVQILCPNPDHPEKRASARLYAQTNSIHCFKCGRSWDVVGLVVLVRRLPVDEALGWLEQQFAIPPLRDDAPELVRATVAASGASGDLASLMVRLRSTRGLMPKARYLRAWVLFDVLREQALDPEERLQIRETLDQWTREALA